MQGLSFSTPRKLLSFPPVFPLYFRSFRIFVSCELEKFLNQLLYLQVLLLVLTDIVFKSSLYRSVKVIDQGTSAGLGTPGQQLLTTSTEYWQAGPSLIRVSIFVT